MLLLKDVSSHNPSSLGGRISSSQYLMLFSLIKRDNSHFFFIKDGPFPASFLIYFHLFKQTLQFLQQINEKKCPSSIQSWDSNQQSLEHESPPITTRPELPP